MGVIIGIDEAGYGPTLGPLVVSAAAFEIPTQWPEAEPAPFSQINLWDRLGGPLRPAATATASALVIDDSKKVYQSGRGGARLEEGVLAFWASTGQAVPPDWTQWLRAVAPPERPGPEESSRTLSPESAWRRPNLPWYADRRVPMPVAVERRRIEERASEVGSRLTDADCRFLGFRSRALQVPEFNHLARQTQNKAAVLFRLTAELIEAFWSRFSDRPLAFVIDKHGSRKAYRRLLELYLWPCRVRIVEEGAAESTYLVSRNGHTATVAFLRQGDQRQMPVSLASMCSKYSRELHMKAFNAFWAEQAPGIRPTAGYAVDARRFLREIDPLLPGLCPDAACLIRAR